MHVLCSDPNARRDRLGERKPSCRALAGCMVNTKGRGLGNKVNDYSCNVNGPRRLSVLVINHIRRTILL